MEHGQQLKAGQIQRRNKRRIRSTYYVAKGYSYGVVSCGSVFKSGNLVEITSYTSNSKHTNHNVERREKL